MISGSSMAIRKKRKPPVSTARPPRRPNPSEARDAERTQATGVLPGAERTQATGDALRADRTQFPGDVRYHASEHGFASGRPGSGGGTSSKDRASMPSPWSLDPGRRTNPTAVSAAAGGAVFGIPIGEASEPDPGQPAASLGLRASKSPVMAGASPPHSGSGGSGAFRPRSLYRKARKTKHARKKAGTFMRNQS